MQRSFIPGTPVVPDIDAIERELGAMWESPSQHEGKGVLLRACAGNLIALAYDRDSAGHLYDVLASVAQQHPLRSLVAYRENIDERAGADDSAPVRAWISAQCSMPVAGGPQVCSEIITLAATEDGLDAVTNLIASVLIPDLPVYIYLPCFATPLGAIVARLATWASLLVLDSRHTGYSPVGSPSFLQLVSSPPAAVPVRDLEWSRLTVWRDLVSQFFDAPERRALPYEISRVEIEASRPACSIASPAALLLSGWLASRLGWIPSSAEFTNGLTRVHCSSNNGEVLINLEETSAPAGQTPRIEAVSLHTRTGRMFAVKLDRPSSCLAVAAATAATSDIRHAVPDEEPDEASLLVRELSITGEDLGFQQALSHAISIVGLLR